MQRISEISKPGMALPTEDSNALTATSQRDVQRSQRLVSLLAFLAEARQVAISEQTFRVYLTVLAKHAYEDVDSAVRKLAEEPRAAYKPAFPEIGDIVECVERARKQRTSPPKFVPCSQCINGFAYLDESGEPCDVSASPDRVMGMCRCKRDWVDERRRRVEEAA